MISASILILTPAYLLVLLFVFRRKKTETNITQQEKSSFYRMSVYFFLLLLIVGFVAYYVGTLLQKIPYSDVNTFFVLPNSSIWIIPCLFLAIPIAGFFIRYIHLVDSKTQYRSMIHWLNEHTGLDSQKVINWFLLPLFVASLLLFRLTINWYTCILIDQNAMVIGDKDSYQQKTYPFSQITYFGCEDMRYFPDGKERVKPYYKIEFNSNDEWDLRDYQLDKTSRNNILDKISSYAKVPIVKCE